jgi:hypothetical protein
MLEEIVASRTAAVRSVQCAKIVLLAFAKKNNEQVGEVVGLNPQQVSVWQERRRDDWERLISIECSESRCEYEYIRYRQFKHLRQRNAGGLYC